MASAAFSYLSYWLIGCFATASMPLECSAHTSGNTHRRHSQFCLVRWQTNILARARARYTPRAEGYVQAEAPMKGAHPGAYDYCMDSTTYIHRRVSMQQPAHRLR